MAPHPEGGFYAETFRSEAAEGSGPEARAVVSVIYFLLEAEQRSHWHRVDAIEIWLWHAGSPLRLSVSSDGRHLETILLGSALASGERPQAVVPEAAWQSAESTGAWTLVSCIVAPAFSFEGFTLAPPGWSPHL